MRIHGRRSLALVVSWDAILTTGVVLAILLSNFDGFDLLFFALHSTHIFSVLLGYVVVHYSALTVAALRILSVTYFIALLFDLVVLVSRIAMASSGGGSVPLLHQTMRVALAFGLMVVDVSGAFFADLSRSSAETLLVRTDEELQMLAYQRHALEVARLKRVGNSTSSGGMV